MTFQPRSAAQLANVLERLQTSDSYQPSEQASAPISTPTSSSVPTTSTERQDEAGHGYSTASRSRTATYNLSSSGLLTNLTATCQQTNTKLDGLSDQITRLSNTLDTMVRNQERQLELLAAISRHTLNSVSSSRSETSTRDPQTPASQQAVIKDFGYSTTIDLLSDMVAKLIGIVEVQVSARNKRYRSSRDMTQSTLQTAVSVACKATFRVEGKVLTPLTIPTAKSVGALTVAKRIGTTNGVRPALNALAFKQIMDDPDCRTITTLLGDIIFRLCEIRWMLPYYEADILRSLEFPYIDQEAQILCTWNALRDRPETLEERRVIEAQATKRKKIGELLANGCSVKSAINAVLTT